jgi:hypothetical protein
MTMMAADSPTAEIPLAERHAEALRELKAEALRLQMIERDLEQFLSEYFTAVEDYMESLQVEHQAKSAFLAAAMPEAERIESERFAAALPKKKSRKNPIQTLYRRAARAHHPDVAQAKTPDAMRGLTEARDKGDIVTLVLASLPADEAGELPEKALEALCAELIEWRDCLAARRASLLESPAYALYLKALEARLAGRDWFGAIRQAFQQRLTAQGKGQLALTA